MIAWLLQILGVKRDYGLMAAGLGAARDPGWEKLEKQLRVEWPTCECCGQPTEQIHHILPFHKARRLELCRDNLAAVCQPCHFRIAHGGNWRCWVPDFRRLAHTVLSAIKARSE